MEDKGVISWLLKEHKPKDSRAYQSQDKFGGAGQVFREFKKVNFESGFDKYVEKEQFKQKKLLAQIFCQRGFDYEYTSKLIHDRGLKIHMPRSKFIAQMKVVMNETFRNLQYFLREDCQRQIKPLTFNQMKQLYPILLHCKTQTKLNEHQQQTLLKFMKATYGMEKVMIFEEETVNLYSTSYHAMKNSDPIEEDPNRKKRAGPKNRHLRPKRNLYERFWNEDMIKQMLQVYQRNHQMVRIKNYFEQVYPEKMEAFTRKNLKAKFLKVIRRAIMKAKNFAFADKTGSFMKVAFLGYYTIKSILNETYFLKVRNILSELYLMDTLTMQNAGDKLKIINQEIKKYYEQYDIEQQQEREKASEKPQFKTQFQLNQKYLKVGRFEKTGFYYDSDEDFNETEEESLSDSIIDVEWDSE